MIRRTAGILLGVLVALLPLVALAQTGHDRPGPHGAAAEEYPALPKPGEKIPLGPEHYFVYGFDRAPRLGPLIVKVQVFTKSGKPDTTFTVQAEADMPSMRGAHATGFKEFKVSNRGDYVLPVTLVMPGQWEIRFIFLKSGKPLLRGRHAFSI